MHDSLGPADPLPADGVTGHRHSAIVSMDAVDYSTRITADGDNTVRTVRRYHTEVIAPGIERYGGSLIGRAGDSWLVEFASADRALRFAQEVQAALGPGAELPLRAGVHFGEVIAGDTTLHGAGIIIAVRLQGLARRGGVTFSAAVRDRLGPDAGFAIREIGPRVVKNIPDPVWVYRLATDAEGADEAAGADAHPIGPAADAPTRDPAHPPAGAGAAPRGPDVARCPAVAVLAFRGPRPGEAATPFCEGLAAGVLDGLTRARWIPVLSHGGPTRPGEADDPREVGRRLGARYVVGGSVRPSERRLEVQAWLVETEGRRLIWSRRYDREPGGLFEPRDELARVIAATVETEFCRAEQARSRAGSVAGLDDWGLVMRGRWHMDRLTREDAPVALDLFERALARDPASLEAYIHLAWWHFWDGWARRGPMESWVEMARFARRAVGLDRQDARAVMLMGIADFMRGEAESGRKLLAHAVRLNPGLGLAHAGLGSTHIIAGDPQAALDPLQVALALGPNDAYAFHTLGEVAVARLMLGHYGQAVAAAEASLQERPGYLYAHVVRVGALARLGRVHEARHALAELLARRPNVSARDVEWLPYNDRRWNRHLLDGLALAGFHVRGTGPETRLRA